MMRAHALEGHRQRGRRHQHQHAGRVRAPLRLDVGVEDDRDEERDAGEQRDERPRRARPFGRHAVARQVSGHEIQQARHRRRARKPEDGDRADVVDRPEHIAEVVMGEVRERTPGRLATFAERLGGNEERRDERAADEQHAHDQRGGTKQLPRVPNAARRTFRGIAGISFHQRHHGDAGLESRQAQRELRKEQKRHEQHRHRVGVLCQERVRPAGQVLGMRQHLADADGEHDHVEREIDGDDRPRRGQSLPESPSGRSRRARSAARS